MWVLVGHATFGLCDMVSITQDEEIMYLTEQLSKVPGTQQELKNGIYYFFMGVEVEKRETVR